METLKKCSKCNVVKNGSEFHIRKESSDGLVSHCKLCRSKKRKAYYLTNRDIELTQHKAYYDINKKAINEQKKQYYQNNIDNIRALHREHYLNNKYMYHIAFLKRQQSIKQATISGYEKEIRVIYKNRPEDCHVDHIVPLQGKNVSGLHVPWNLQYLPAEENLSKGNKI